MVESRVEMHQLVRCRQLTSGFGHVVRCIMSQLQREWAAMNCGLPPSLLVVLWIALASPALAQPADPPQHRGTIKSVARSHLSFVMVDRRSGVDVSIPLTAETRYTFGGREGAEFVDVIVVGDRVVATLDEKGVAVEVRNRNNYGRPASSELKQMLAASDEE